MNFIIIDFLEMVAHTNSNQTQAGKQWQERASLCVFGKVNRYFSMSKRFFTTKNDE